ncbi:A-kinase anchor protein 6-like protein [Lates japonicus]|uniref:A-kinase anchor protein 6-like protein n=1 Tax=Lates japonicus TaxID=270547 RepID=A0AAD3QXU3_LATJO|nr:A-kinase anchor protein 6-like protein [Lates japonicus]
MVLTRKPAEYLLKENLEVVFTGPWLQTELVLTYLPCSEPSDSCQYFASRDPIPNQAPKEEKRGEDRTSSVMSLEEKWCAAVSVAAGRRGVVMRTLILIPGRVWPVQNLLRGRMFGRY